MKMLLISSRTPLVFVSGMLLTVSAAGQTWTYDPDSGGIPNEAGQPLETGYQAGSNSYRQIVDLGGGDKVLEVDTSPDGAARSIYWGASGPGSAWTVDSSAGYSVQWKVKLDSNVLTTQSAAGFFAGDASNWGFMRAFNTYAYNGSQYLQLELLSAAGSGVVHNLGNVYAWHTYRMDIQNGVGKVYVDDYHTPVATRALTASGAHSLYFGDGTDGNNGKYQIDHVKTWQSGVVGAPTRPNAAVINHTMLHASYDGNTGNGGMDADYARGSNVAIGTGGVIGTPGKFSSKGGLNSYQASGTVNYPVANNFNPDSGTVEMWVKTDNWNNADYYGFFDVYKAGQVDIRLQKTTGNQLQAYMADIPGGKSWSITAASQLLDTDWHHIAWSWDKNVNMSFLYLDGVPIANLSNVSIANLTGVDFTGSITDATIEVGSIQDGSAPFNGLIDEFRISDFDLYQGGTFTPQNAPFELQKWAVDSDGTWSTGSNWTGGVPNYVGATANFLNNTTLPRTIAVDGLQTVGILRFDSAQGYTLNGPGTLAMDVGTFDALIDVRSGSHTINPSVLLAKNLNAQVAGGATINITSDVLTPGGVSLSKTGAGTMIMKNLRMDGVDVAAGTLRVSAKSANNDASGVSLVTGVTAAGKLDLTNNAMAIEYSGSSPLASVRALVQAGYVSGSWNGNGITSSAAAAQALTSVKTTLIVLESSERAAIVSGDFFGQTVDDTAVLIQYGLSADATLDGKVNTLDFNSLAGSFGGLGGWTNGDFNYDGTVNSGDFNLLVGNYGKSMPSAAANLGAVVPEPTLVAVFAAAMPLSMRRRRR
jgi:hypothetical protein